MSKLAKALTAAAGNAGAGALYVEDVFSTYLYTGNGTSQTITNGIDLSGEGGLVWMKGRSSVIRHSFFDTERGANKYLMSNTTDAQTTVTDQLMSFNSDGFTLGSDASTGVNGSGTDYASWTFRKAEKFFDVVTYTGNSVSGRQINHSLGSAPSVIIIKGYNQNGRWWIVYHRSLGATNYLQLSTTGASAVSSAVFNDTDPTDTVFTVGNSSHTNGSASNSYVAYLFASDAGGFGDDGSESIIKCGSYTGTSSIPYEVDCGFEPQWVMIKNTTSGSANGWYMVDMMRGMTDTGDSYLYANTSDAEVTNTAYKVYPTATGFGINTNTSVFNGNGSTYIYIAIRRPMKTPESGTEVFAVDTGTANTYTSNFAIDFNLTCARAGGYNTWFDRLRGGTKYLYPALTDAEADAGIYSTSFDSNTEIDLSSWWGNTNTVNYAFKRATGFFDVVAYTGNGTSSRSLNHNLGVTPELMIIKQRSAARSWAVYSSATGTGKFLKLEDTAGVVTQSGIFDTAPTSSVFTVDSNTYVNISGGTYIAYLFATLAGVSKVGSYTGTGSNVNVDCGFSAGARFILIKRTDSTGDWYVWDSVRGIVAGNDPYLLLNSTAAEVTSTDYIDPLASGFTVTSTAPAALNASGGSFVYLAIA